jgi:hypothetical protein
MRIHRGLELPATTGKRERYAFDVLKHGDAIEVRSPKSAIIPPLAEKDETGRAARALSRAGRPPILHRGRAAKSPRLRRDLEMRVLGLNNAIYDAYQPFFPHQEEGIDFALADGKSAVMLAHAAGTGKTRTGITVADRIDAKRVLVICPGLAVYVWADQIEKWARASRLVHIVKDARDVLPLVGVVIVTYDQLSTNPKLVRRLIEAGWDLLLIDEAHALKEPNSKRTRAVYGTGCKGGAIASTAARVVLLTGTPMLANPAELWTHLSALAPGLLQAPGRDSFVERYCVTETIWRGHRQFEQIKGAKVKAIRDLRERLSPFIHRVRKQDVLKDLPPLLRTVVPIHPSALVVPEALIKEWRLAEAELTRDVGVKSGDEMLAAVNASSHSATVRRLTGVIKVQAALAELRVELAESQDDKLIVFAYHRAGLWSWGLRAMASSVSTGRRRTTSAPASSANFKPIPRFECLLARSVSPPRRSS